VKNLSFGGKLLAALRCHCQKMVPEDETRGTVRVLWILLMISRCHTLSKRRSPWWCFGCRMTSTPVDPIKDSTCGATTGTLETLPAWLVQKVWDGLRRSCILRCLRLE